MPQQHPIPPPVANSRLRDHSQYDPSQPVPIPIFDGGALPDDDDEEINQQQQQEKKKNTTSAITSNPQPRHTNTAGGRPYRPPYSNSRSQQNAVSGSNLSSGPHMRTTTGVETSADSKNTYLTDQQAIAWSYYNASTPEQQQQLQMQYQQQWLQYYAAHGVLLGSSTSSIDVPQQEQSETAPSRLLQQHQTNGISQQQRCSEDAAASTQPQRYLQQMTGPSQNRLGIESPLARQQQVLPHHQRHGSAPSTMQQDRASDSYDKHYRQGSASSMQYHRGQGSPSSVYRIPPPSQKSRQNLDTSDPLIIDGAPDMYAALLQNTAGGLSSYGATSTNRSRLQQLPPPRSRANSASQPQTVLPIARNPPDPPYQHRRSASDSLAKQTINNSNSGTFPRRGSGSSPRLSLDPRNNVDIPVMRSPRGGAGGSNSIGGGSIGHRSPSHQQKHHRRSSSLAGGQSVASQVSYLSEVSVVTDIRKSAFFGGIDEGTGEAKLYFPFEFVHLVPTSGRGNNSSLTCMGFPLQLGHLYQVRIDNERFEAYHRVAEDVSMGWFSDHHNNELGDDHCRCDCPFCATCTRKADSRLPPNFYCLAVDEDNLYKRVVDEICAAQQMPWGLFFCGHHEDVARPSICIPVTVLILLFGAMAYASYAVRA